MPDEQAAAVQIEWPEDALWPQGGYGNVFLVNHTPWDFTIRVGYVALPSLPPGTPVPPEGVRIVASPVAQITLSPVAFRQLSIVLQEQIARYTAAYGEIGGGDPSQGLA